MRYTIIDPRGAVSLVGPCHALKMLVAACAKMPSTLGDLLGHLQPLDAQFADFIASGLAVFDEHHLPPDVAGAAANGANGANGSNGSNGANGRVFRVIDPASRQASLQPVVAGLVVFNLNERRIVQVQNSYAEVARRDRGRLRRAGRPVQTYYYYDLPETWRIVP
jgi:hypothetical protein